MGVALVASAAKALTRSTCKDRVCVAINATAAVIVFYYPVTWVFPVSGACTATQTGACVPSPRQLGCYQQIARAEGSWPVPSAPLRSATPVTATSSRCSCGPAAPDLCSGSWCNAGGLGRLGQTHQRLLMPRL